MVLQAEIKRKQPPFQHNLYERCVFFFFDFALHLPCEHGLRAHKRLPIRVLEYHSRSSVPAQLWRYDMPGTGADVGIRERRSSVIAQ